MNKIKTIIGAVTIGISSFFSGYILAKKKYENLADKEVESVKKRLTDFYKKTLFKDDKIIKNEEEKEDTIMPEVDNVDNKNINYAGLYQSTAKESAKTIDEIKESAESKVKKPYPITPEEFEESNNTCETLFWFEKDKILEDSDGNRVKCMDAIVGENNLKRFKQYNTDVIYIRNEGLKTDFEVCLDERIHNEMSENFASVEEEDNDD